MAVPASAEGFTGIIVERGWLVAYRGEVQCVYMDQRCNDASYAKYLTELGAQIDRSQGRRGILYYVPSPYTLSAERRQELAKVLSDRKERVARSTAAYAMVTESRLVQGLLTAIWWLSPPPYPRKVTTSLAAGFEFIGKHVANVDADDMARRLKMLITRLEPAISGVH